MRRTEGAQAKRAPAGRLGRSLNLFRVSPLRWLMAFMKQPESAFQK